MVVHIEAGGAPIDRHLGGNSVDGVRPEIRQVSSHHVVPVSITEITGQWALQVVAGVGGRRGDRNPICHIKHQLPLLVNRDGWARGHSEIKGVAPILLIARSGLGDSFWIERETYLCLSVLHLIVPEGLEHVLQILIRCWVSGEIAVGIDRLHQAAIEWRSTGVYVDGIQVRNRQACIWVEGVIEIKRDAGHQIDTVGG